MDLKFGARPEPANGRYATLPALHTLVRTKALPPVPVSMTVSENVTNWGMLGNALWGDCVAAGILHTIHAWTAWAKRGNGVHGTVEQALAFYTAVTRRYPGNYPVPFDPNDPNTDNGLVPSDAFHYWWQYGLEDGQPAKDFIKGFATLRTGADAYVDTQRAVAWSGAGGNYWALPNSAIEQFDHGSSWTPIADDGGEAGGHFAPTLAYADQTGQSSTWAKLQPTTADFYARYMAGGIVAVSADGFAANGLNPDAIDMAALETAMAQFADHTGG